MLRCSPTRLAAATVAALALLPVGAQAATPAQIQTSVNRAVTWATADAQLGADGSFDDGFGGGFGGNLVPGALAAAGRNASDVQRSSGATGTSKDYLQSLFTGTAFTTPSSPSASPQPTSVGTFANSILVGYSAGFDPARIASNQNLVAQMAAYYDDGYFRPTAGNRFISTATFTAMALNRVGAPQFLRDRAAAAIKANQRNDGSWEYRTIAELGPQNSGDPDTTGAALSALCGAGLTTGDPAIQAGLNYLRTIQSSTTGGLGADADATGWAVSGLQACGINPQGAQFTKGGKTPVDFLLTQQLASGAFQPGFAPGTESMYTTVSALRALAGAGFSANPPARSNPANSPEVAPPSVPGGTSVPIALAVDDGAGSVTFCRVTVPSGSSVATLLATSNGSSVPGGCATGGEFTSGQLSKLNGRTGTWAISIDDGPEQVAASQAIRFGDFVALRRTGRAVPAAPIADTTGNTTPPPAAVPAAVQARTTPTGVASRSLRVSAKKRVVSVSLSCAQANRLCEGTVYFVDGKRSLGRRAFLIGGGKTTKLNVKLSKSSVKRFGKKARKVKVNTFSRDGAGIASNATKTVTLTPTK